MRSLNVEASHGFLYVFDDAYKRGSADLSGSIDEKAKIDASSANWWYRNRKIFVSFSVLQGSTKVLLELQNLLLKFSRCPDICDKLKEPTFVDKFYAVNK